MSAETVNVEVAYALPERQAIIHVELEIGATASQAIERSGILREFPNIDYPNCKIGVFGKSVSADTVLQAGDRVEIYRPLLADPKEVRRQRASEGKTMKKN
ncbi:MAG: RnfH family protein [Pseudomonadota bacterium]